MGTQQNTPEQALAQTTQQRPRSVFDDIVENHSAREQAEQAKADKLCADTYSNDPNSYAIAMGRELGLNAALSLQLIHIINGKPALSAGARATFLAKAGYSWRPVVHTDKQCTLRFYFHGDVMTDVNGQPLDVSITIEDAERAGWATNSRGDKKVGNYDKVPKNMLFARVISNFHRWYAPHVVGVQMYDAGEITMDSVVAATETASKSKLDKIEAELIAAIGSAGTSV